MYLTCLEKPSVFTPFPVEVYSDSGGACCYVIDCELKLNPGDTSVGITNLQTNFTAGCPFSIISIEGVPYTNPIGQAYYLTTSNSVFLKIEICPCDSPGGTWTADFIIDYIDSRGIPGTESITYGFTEINPFGVTTDPIDPAFTSMDLFPCVGTTNCTNLVAGDIPFTNHSDIPLEITIDLNGNLPPSTVYYLDGVLQPFTIMTIAPQQTVQIGFGFCWPNYTPISFDIFVDFCASGYHRRIAVNIIPVNCYGCGLGVADFDIITENNYLPVFNAGPNYQLPNVYTESSFGERKTFEWTLVYNNGFVNGDVDIYFNPYLFTNIASISSIDPYSLSIPNVGWHKRVTGFMVGGGPFQMQQVTNNQYQPNQKNWEAFIELNSNGYSFKISFTFYFMMDIDNGMTNTYLDNDKKLYYNNIYAVAPNDFITFGSDVYKANTTLPRYFAKDVLLIDNRFDDLSTGIPRPYRCYFYDSFPLASRYINKGIGVTNSEFLNPTFYFYRNGNPWTPNFSIFDDTYIYFIIDIPAAYTCTSMVAYIINVNEFDNTVDFKTNYDFSRAEILTNAVPGVINNLIEAPSVGPTNFGPAPSGGSYWTIEFTVGSGNVVSTGQYVIGIIVYDNVNQIVNTFCYPNPSSSQSYIGVDTIPNESSLCCPLTIQKSWSDYVNTYTNAYPFVTTYKQRLENKLIVEGGLFASNCLFGNFGYQGNWVDLIQSVELRVYKPFVPMTTGYNQYKFQLYYQNVFSNRDTNYPNNFNNQSSSLTVKDNGSGQLEIAWNGRPNYQYWITPTGNDIYIMAYVNEPYNLLGPIGSGTLTNNTINGIPLNLDWSIYQPYINSNSSAPPVNASPQTFAGEVLFDYIIKIDLSSVLGLPTFYVNKVIQQSLWIYPEEGVIDYTNKSVWTNVFGKPFEQKTLPLYIEGWNGTAHIPLFDLSFCKENYTHIKVTVIKDPAVVSLPGYIIIYANKQPFSIINIKEDDYGITNNPSPTGMVKLDTNYIYDVTIGPLPNGPWEFKIDTSNLADDVYEICAMYIPS